MTNGHPGNRSKGFASYVAMADSWRSACLKGAIQGPLHEHSLIKIIVSRNECRRRIVKVYREEAAKRRRAAMGTTNLSGIGGRAPAHAPGASPTATDSAATAAATTAAAVDEATAAASNLGASAAAAPGGDPAPPPPGGDLHGLGDAPWPPGMTSIPGRDGDPPAWVVIRGARPGVYYFRYAVICVVCRYSTNTLTISQELVHGCTRTSRRRLGDACFEQPGCRSVVPAQSALRRIPPLLASCASRP